MSYFIVTLCLILNAEVIAKRLRDSYYVRTCGEQCYYNSNFSSCNDETCRVPDPGNDCQEHVETSNENDWEGLLDECDGKPSCDVINAGGILHSCDLANAEYLTIRYKCKTMDAVIGAVGFTAYARNVLIFGDPFERVIFDGVVSNYGDAYDSTTGEFTCPVTGIYMFALNIANYGGYHMRADIMQESSILLSVWCDSPHWSACGKTVFSTCEQDEIVYIRTGDYTNLRLWGDTVDPSLVICRVPYVSCITT